VGQNSEDEPLYVNAKQYHRILKRRAARAKIEEGNKGNKNKKVQFIPMFTDQAVPPRISS
jgi:nuclear transcription factor Y alpha